MKRFFLSLSLVLSCCAYTQHHDPNLSLFSGTTVSHSDEIALPALHEHYASRIEARFPEGLADPEKKKRFSYAQFGYEFPFVEFAVPGQFGQHEYGGQGRKEKNGCVYTCRGGFIDLSHLRAALDWTVYLTVKILSEEDGFELPYKAGSLEVKLQHTEELTMDEVVLLAQRIAFERLLWHEVASWHFHFPNHLFSEQLSAFTPEDIYSNMAGTEVGKRVVLRLVNGPADLTYEQVATEEIDRFIGSLDPLPNKHATKEVYALVDIIKQQKLPEMERNQDVWWNSRLIFRNQNYVFKRYMQIGPEIAPWLVTHRNMPECSSNERALVLSVPENTHSGKSLYRYYEFRIAPDRDLFPKTAIKKHRHIGFGAFTTDEFPRIVEIVHAEMERVLGPGFDERNLPSPSPDSELTIGSAP